MAAPALTASHIAHELRDVGGRMRPALAPLSCRFDAGRLHIVSGPVGSGKSLLLDILSLAVRPTCGGVWWGAHEVSAMVAAQQARWRRRHVGRVAAPCRLVEVWTVREHLAFAASIRADPDAEARGMALLHGCGMKARLDCHPRALSAGERAYLMLVQALCFRPAIVLVDMPIDQLGAADAAGIMALLRDYARDAVVVCATADRAVPENGDAVLALTMPVG